jgi:hypothetical protein
MTGLTRQQQVLLAFFTRHESTRGDALVTAVYEAFGIGVLAYGQRLNALVRLPAAEAAAPGPVRRYRQASARHGRRPA